MQLSAFSFCVVRVFFPLLSAGLPCTALARLLVSVSSPSVCVPQGLGGACSQHASACAICSDPSRKQSCTVATFVIALCVHSFIL